MRSSRVHAAVCLGVVTAFLSPRVALVAKTRLIPANLQVKNSTPKKLIASQGSSSTRDGVYSAAQAQRGKALYDKQCAACHGATLHGAGMISPLAGDDFMAHWSGRTLADLYTLTQTTMPSSQPGSLTAEETTQLLAYILKANRLPTGKELPQEVVTLKAIQIEKTRSKP